MFADLKAGDINITSKVKRIATIQCLDCGTHIPARGQTKRCKPCSCEHRTKEQALYAKRRLAARKALKEEHTHG